MSETRLSFKDKRWSLHGMTALVTGGTRGIGHAIVQELAEFGASVHICSRNQEDINKCLEEWKAKGFCVTGSACDISHDQRQNLMETVASVFQGKLNILINNAGTTTVKPITDHTAEDISTVMGTNFESGYHLCQLAHPLLKASGYGSIVFISSISGLKALPLCSVYAASKGAMNQFTKNLALEWAKDNIRANVVAPGPVMTVLLESVLGTKIGATLKRSLFYKFEIGLCEGVCYYMSNMGPTANQGEYRSTPHSWKLNFKRETIIRRVDVDMVPPSIYTFTAPDTIWLPTFDRNYLIDVIGILTGVGQQHQYVNKGVQSTLMVIELDNRGFRFNITLFGALVDELQSFLIGGNARNAVLVVTFAKLKEFQGRDTLQSTMYSSRLMINPALPAADDLINRDGNKVAHSIASSAFSGSLLETGYKQSSSFSSCCSEWRQEAYLRKLKMKLGLVLFAVFDFLSLFQYTSRSRNSGIFWWR